MSRTGTASPNDYEIQICRRAFKVPSDAEIQHGKINGASQHRATKLIWLTPQQQKLL